MSYYFDISSSKQNISTPQIAESLLRILERSHLCSIATVNPDGSPHINTCFFSFTGDFRLYVFTSPNTVHANNIEVNPACAVNVFSSSQKIGDDLLGGQLFGTAKQLNKMKGLAAFRNYTNRFPILLTWADSWDAILKGFQSRFYEITISSGKLLDESAFGKEEYISFTIDRW